MATVYKHERTRRDGTILVRWQLGYCDADGNRHRKNFTTKKAADQERIRIEAELQAGTHVPDSEDMTVLDACRGWLQRIEDLVKKGLRERQTLRPYRNHVELYIAPAAIAAIKLNKVRTPDVQLFLDDLQLEVSEAMLRRVLKSLRMAFRNAQQRGWTNGNPAAAAKIERMNRRKRRVQIPAKDELKRLLLAAELMDDAGVTEWAFPFAHTKLFSGMRASEMRGLTKPQLTIAGGNLFEVTVNQRADELGNIGDPKSEAGHRTIPLGIQTVEALRAWFAKLSTHLAKLAEDRPPGAPATPAETLHLVFPNGAGKVESYANIYNRIWLQMSIVAGVVDDPDAPKSKQRMKYGLHALRHAAASIWIEQGLLPKVVQTRMGHATLAMTMDLYGHLWPDPGADAAAADAAERLILG